MEATYVLAVFRRRCIKKRHALRSIQAPSPADDLVKPGILVVGFDAATLDLIDPWTQAGHLPMLGSLVKEGVSARLSSTPNMHSASAWTSILTGLGPGRHGLFVFSDYDIETGRHVFFRGGTARAAQSERTWPATAKDAQGEAVDAGTVKVVGPDFDRLVHETSCLLSDDDAHRSMVLAINPYGNGRAASRIVAVCEEFLGAQQNAAGKKAEWETRGLSR